jgi:hypothetical protein
MFDNNIADDESSTEAADTDYGFIGQEEPAETDGGLSAVTTTSRWKLGSHTMASETVNDSVHAALDEVDDEVDEDLKTVLEDAAGLLNNSSPCDFECPVCGLNHGHHDNKHDIREEFNVEPAFAEQMNYVPYCHCGVNELAMLVDYFGFINEPVFTDQYEFEGVLEIDPEALQDIYRRWSAHGKYSVRSAVHASPWGREVDNSLFPELKKFFQRVDDIKSASSSAPIAGVTRQDIESVGAELDGLTGNE